MGGIEGYFGLDPDEDLLRRLNSGAGDREPDGEGHFVDGRCGLAHRRLAVIDVAGGSQPMATDDGRYTIVFSGEIHNFAALRTQLRDLGVSFRTASDTEVVLKSFAQSGPDCFNHFDGMFAVAVWDREAQRLTLARDHLGIKPLHILNTGPGQWLFASDIGALLASGRYRAVPDGRTSHRYLAFGLDGGGGRTFFQGIERLLPGQHMTLDAGGGRRHFYSRLRDELAGLAQRRVPFTPAQARVCRTQLEDAVRMRLQSEVPAGTMLTNDLGSAAVALALDDLLTTRDDQAAALMGAQQRLFTLQRKPGRRKPSLDDKVAAACGAQAEVHAVPPLHGRLEDELRAFLRAQQEPVASPAGFDDYQLMREASRNVSVLLDAAGACEVMAGGSDYQEVLLRQLSREDIRQAATAFVGGARQGRRGDKVPDHNPRLLSDLLTPAFAADFDWDRVRLEKRNLKLRLLQDLHETSLPGQLRVRDRNAVHFGLEVRSPYLALGLVRHMFELSEDAFVHDGEDFRVVREILRSTPATAQLAVLPASRAGSTRRQLAGEVAALHAILLRGPFLAGRYLDRDALLAASAPAARRHNEALPALMWRAVNLELWLEEFFGPPNPTSAGGQHLLARSDHAQPGHLPADTWRSDDERVEPMKTDNAGSAARAVRSPGPLARARLAVAIGAGRAASAASRLARRGAGVSIRGRVIQTLAPDALGQLLAGKTSLLVTGTNGKTTTTHFLTAALSERVVVTNADGANLQYGIISALSTRPRAEMAVLETDERAVAEVLSKGTTAVLTILNLSRDQLDRNHEITSLAKAWIKALEELGAEGPVVVASNEDPLVVWAASAGRKVIWIDTDAAWTQDGALCPACGAVLERPADAGWRCPGCGLAKPEPSYRVQGATIVGPQGQRWTPQLRVPGSFNIGNAACALAAAVVVGADPDDAISRMDTVEAPAGRFGEVSFDGERSRLLLAKNPAGWATVLPLATAPTVVLAIDSQFADGRDVSWLWDVDFESLAERDSTVIVTGFRAWDMAVRLTYAGVPYRVVPEVTDAVRGHQGRVDVVTTYTPFQVLRKLGGLE